MTLCTWCGGEDAQGPCPKSVTCPRCDAGPGSSCRRPSGHRAARLHSARIKLAENGVTVTATPLPILQERLL